MKELKLFFSLISGDMYYVEEDEVKNLDKSQVPLLKKPKENCKKCYGRFYTMFETIKKYYIPCPKCMKTCVDWDAMKNEEIVIENTKTTKAITRPRIPKRMNSSRNSSTLSDMRGPDPDCIFMRRHIPMIPKSTTEITITTAVPRRFWKVLSGTTRMLSFAPPAGRA